jgi:hypothetical protein
LSTGDVLLVRERQTDRLAVNGAWFTRNDDGGWTEPEWVPPGLHTVETIDVEMGRDGRRARRTYTVHLRSSDDQTVRYVKADPSLRFNRVTD